jgi:isopropylmalate/homocitrate/citramalate synthase
MEPEFVSTDTKVELIDKLSQCGYAKIEVTSFTSAKAIPMLRDAEEVMGRIQRAPNVEYTVLVPNVRGAERAMDVKPDEFNLVMSTSETHNLANLRMPREKSFSALRDVIENFQCFLVCVLWLSHGGRRFAARSDEVVATIRRLGCARVDYLRHNRHGATITSCRNV